MRRPDDCSLSADDLLRIQKHARKALEAADAYGVFPTAIDSVIETAQLLVSDEDVLSEGFLRRMRRTAGKALLRAVDKVLGVMHIAARTMYLDRAVHAAKIPFLKLHESAHAILPWQSKIYAVTEECSVSLDPFVAEQFEREANVFATEVMFQLDTFSEEAHQHAFGILVPVRLSKKFGSSIYMAMRRYVADHHRTCVVLVIEPPQLHHEHGFTADLRRVVASKEFTRKFGSLSVPETFTPGDKIGAMIPTGSRRMSGKRQLCLVDRNGVRHECLAESFTQGHQVFVLIHVVAALNRVIVQSA